MFGRRVWGWVGLVSWRVRGIGWVEFEVRVMLIRNRSLVEDELILILYSCA